jgi:hypothetical protein
MSTDTSNLTETDDHLSFLNGDFSATLTEDAFSIIASNQTNLDVDCSSIPVEDMSLDWGLSALMDFNNDNAADPDNSLSPKQLDRLKSTNITKPPSEGAQQMDTTGGSNANDSKEVVNGESNPFFDMGDEPEELSQWYKSLPTSDNQLDLKQEVPTTPDPNDIIDMTNQEDISQSRHHSNQATKGSPRAARNRPSRPPTRDNTIMTTEMTEPNFNSRRLLAQIQPSSIRNHVASFVETHHPNPYYRRRSISTPPENTGRSGGTVFHRRTMNGDTCPIGRGHVPNHPPPGYGSPMYGTPIMSHATPIMEHASQYGHPTPLTQSCGPNTPMQRMSPGPQAQRTPPTKARSHPYQNARDSRQRGATRPIESADSRPGSVRTASPVDMQQQQQRRAAASSGSLVSQSETPKRKYTPRQTTQRSSDIVDAKFLAEEYQSHCEQLLTVARYSTRVWQDAVTMDADMDPRMRA